MSRKQPSTQDVADLIWVCRRLAAALQDGEEIVPALDAIGAHAPSGPGRLLRAMRESFVAGDNLGRGLISLGFPSFMWSVILTGEHCSMIPDALSRLVERLEAEQATPAPRDRRLYSYSLAFGRLGMMLKSGVPVLQAMQLAAESVSDDAVRTVFTAVREAAAKGLLMSNAFANSVDDLPPMVIEMIADTEVAGRLDDGVSVISDYLLDEAGQVIGRECAPAPQAKARSPRASKKEAHHA